MADSSIQIIPGDVALNRITETVKRSAPGDARFILIVGAGFSQGLVPTTRDIVLRSLPLLDKSFVATLPPKPSATSHASNQPDYEIRHQEEEAKRRAVSFWGKFLRTNESAGLKLPLSPAGLPCDVQLAYKYAFDNRAIWPFENRAAANKFLRGLMRLNNPRLNAAHFLLASILGTQSSSSASQSVKKTKAPNLFKYEAAFSRLILTTNFDPFLQIALQFANRLYYMSDTPDLEEKDLSENPTDAIHLVYVHGSIHRHAQANTDSEIQTIKDKNAKVLAPVLKNHAVIVIGYSGWDDAIVEALSACQNFEHGLYWLGLRPNPLQEGAFGPRALDIMRKSGACYVPIKGAGHFMNQLNSRLVNGLPLLDNPISQIREKLSAINLIELHDMETGSSEVPLKGLTQVAHNIVGKSTYMFAKELALKGLAAAEDVFLKQCEDGSIGHLESKARSTDLWVDRMAVCNKALAIPTISIPKQASFLQLRAQTYSMAEMNGEAIIDWTQIIETSNIPNKARWEALLGRAMAFWKKALNQEEEKIYLAAALTDLTSAVAEIPSDPATSPDLRKLRATCLFYRGGVFCDSGKLEESISDFTTVLEAAHLEDAAGLGFYIRGLFSRAYVWEISGEPDKAIEDYTRILQSPYRPPCGQNAEALTKRAWVYYSKNDFVSFLCDTEKALQNSSPPKVAMFHLGLALLANGRDADALDAYHRAAKQNSSIIHEAGLPDLKEATDKWLTAERANPCINLLETFKPSKTA